MTNIEIVTGDITEIEVDAIVNAANSSLLGGGGVDGAIHRAGGPEILSECRQLRASTYPMGFPTGDAVATTAGLLPAKWVIHTVGPIYSTTEDRAYQLQNAYKSSLRVADELGADSISFPLISGGAYGWPIGDAIYQGITTIRASEFEFERIVFVAFSDETADLMRQISQAADVG